jgi:hypothetical protein
MFFIPFCSDALKDSKLRNQLASMCHALSPTTLQAFLMLCKTYSIDGGKKLGGLGKCMGIWIWIEKDEIVCCALATGNFISRIYTVPSHRGKGYAQRLLMLLPLLVPTIQAAVDDDVTGLFEKAGWNLVRKTRNKDGTLHYAVDVEYHKNQPLGAVELFALHDEPTKIALDAFRKCKPFNQTKPQTSQAQKVSAV